MHTERWLPKIVMVWGNFLGVIEEFQKWQSFAHWLSIIIGVSLLNDHWVRFVEIGRSFGVFQSVEVTYTALVVSPDLFSPRIWLLSAHLFSYHRDIYSTSISSGIPSFQLTGRFCLFETPKKTFSLSIYQSFSLQNT